VLFAASLEGLIAVASTGLWASIDCLLVTGDEDLDLLITAGRYRRRCAQASVTASAETPQGR
jgi:hypothetical protein